MYNDNGPLREVREGGDVVTLTIVPSLTAHLRPSGAPTLAALGPVETLRVAVDPVLGLGGVKQDLEADSD